MKWSSVLQQKLKAAFLLCSIMLVIILATVVSRNSMLGVGQSFSSLYSDRLIPATTIIYLSENLYGKRLAMEKYLFSDDVNSDLEVSRSMQIHRRNTDSLLSAFSKTFLTTSEIQRLEDYKKYDRESVRLEKRILALQHWGNNKKAREVFEEEGLLIFQRSIESLNALTGIQSDVGKELMKESKRNVANMILISFLQIGLAVVVGISILILVKNSKIIDQPRVTPHERSFFNLN